MDPQSQSQNRITYECCICLEQGTEKVYDTKDNWECESAHSGKVCPDCINALKNEGSNCPICRAPLTPRFNTQLTDNQIIDNIFYNYQNVNFYSYMNDIIENLDQMIEIENINDRTIIS